MIVLEKNNIDQRNNGGIGGAVVTHSPSTSKVSSSNPRSYLGKLVVAYRWWEVYSTEP